MSNNYTALVLQGGGALGAYEYGVLKALYEQDNFSPDVISGVSIGAFSAAVLTGAIGDPIDALGELWKCFTTKALPLTPQPMQQAMSLSYNQGMYSPNPYAYWNPLLTTHFYNTESLYTTLKKVIDLDKLNSKQSPHLIITATNIETGYLETFDNREMDITFDHIVASGSLPPSFPMIDIDGNSYWDGGLFSNTPLKPAFKALEKLGSDKDQREMILIELFPHAGKKPQNMHDVFDRMIELTFECKLRYDSQQYQRVNQYIDLMRAIDQELPKDSKLKKEPTYQKLMSYKKIHTLSVIKNTSPEPLLGSADFTRKTIERRIQHGYQDGQASLHSNTTQTNPQQTSVPPSTPTTPKTPAKETAALT